MVALGGDMVSGTIHDELLETNDTDIMPQVVSITEAIIAGLEKLLDAFGRIAVFALLVITEDTPRKNVLSVKLIKVLIG